MAQTDGRFDKTDSGEPRLEENLREAAGEAGHRTEQMAEEAKTGTADRMADASQAVHGAADQLGAEMPQAARVIHSAAEKLESASTALRERSFEDLAADFNSFAKGQPMVAFAGSVLAGFALTRFLKSSRPDNSRMEKRS